MERSASLGLGRRRVRGACYRGRPGDVVDTRCSPATRHDRPVHAARHLHAGIFVASMGCGASELRLLRNNSSIREPDPVCPRRRSAEPAVAGAAPSRHRPAVAFTLIEIPVSIIIIAVLVAIIVPTLGFQRTANFDTKSIAFLKSHAATFSLYAADWKDRLPFFTDPSQPTTPVSNPARGFTVQASHFSSHFDWTVALADPYYEGDHHHESFFYPGGGTRRRDRMASLRSLPIGTRAHLWAHQTIGTREPECEGSHNCEPTLSRTPCSRPPKCSCSNPTRLSRFSSHAPPLPE